MVRCSAPGCRNKTQMKRKNETRLSFFRFPKDPVMNELWVQMIRRKDWRPSAHSRLCSEHFSQDQIYPHYATGLHLREGAVPNIFTSHHSNSNKPNERTEDSLLDTTGFMVVEVIQLGNAEDGRLSGSEETQLENPKLEEITQEEDPLLTKMGAALEKAQGQSSPTSDTAPSTLEEPTEVKLQDLERTKTIELPLGESISHAKVKPTESIEVEEAFSQDEADNISHEAKSITHFEAETNSQPGSEIISHGEAEYMLSKCLEWFEQQAEADSSQISLLRNIRDVATRKARESILPLDLDDSKLFRVHR